MKRPAAEVENPSIPELVDFISEVSEYIISLLDEMREVHSEASRLWKIFHDDQKDSLLMVQLNSMLLCFSALILLFADNRLHTVGQLKELASLISGEHVDPKTKGFVQSEMNRVTSNYAQYMPQFEQIRDVFAKSAAPLLFPVKTEPRT